MRQAESVLRIESGEPGDVGEPTATIPAFENGNELDRFGDEGALRGERGASS